VRRSIRSAPDTLHSRLGPLLVFLSDSDSHDELHRRLEALWAKADVNGDGRIHFVELCCELRAYNMPFTLGEWFAMLREGHKLRIAGLPDLDRDNPSALIEYPLNK
jgi:hypothetical protein